LGIELNIEYVNLIQNRLSQPFAYFDSVDPRMERVPNDLNNDEIREQYLIKHKEWFLKNHSDATEHFEQEVEKKYRANLEHSIKNQDIFNF